jgi:hypothetical protein
MIVAHYKDKIDEALADVDRIIKALQAGVRGALRRHKKAENPIVVMKDGQMVLLKPEEIQV